MKQSPTVYTSNRVLKLNVGFLLNDGPGNSHKTEFDVPTVRVSDDLTLNYIRGPLRLSRTKEGILVQGTLTVGLPDECYRCLDKIERAVNLELEELFAYPTPQGTEFSIKEDAVLDLAPLVRAETVLEASTGALCKEDCKGICPTCGANCNRSVCHCETDEIDPRLAKLKELLD